MKTIEKLTFEITRQEYTLFTFLMKDLLRKKETKKTRIYLRDLGTFDTQLKQSAIEDIKELQKDDNKTKKGDIQITERAGVIKYIKKKFGITGEDLKPD